MWQLSNIIPRTFGKQDLIGGERIVAIVHRHIYRLIKENIFPVVIGFIILVISFVSINNISKSQNNNKDILVIIFLVFIFISLFVLFLKMLSSWINHKFDVLVITNKRVIYIDRHFIAGQSVKEIALNKITTIRTDCHSIFANMLGYARLDIDSADDGQHIEFLYAPKVEQIRSIINKEKEEFLNHDIKISKTDNLNDNKSSAITEAYNSTVESNSNNINKDRFSKIFALEQEIGLLRNDYSLLQQKVDLLEQHIQKIYSNKQ